MRCTISLSLASSGMALQNARAAAFEEILRRAKGFANLLADRFTVYAVFGCYTQHQFLFTQNLSSSDPAQHPLYFFRAEELSDGWQICQ